MMHITMSLEIATLGRFEVRRNHELLTGGNWSRRKVVDLFKLLLSAEQHRLHREQIQEILWPDSDLEQASNSLGKTLYLLRRALEPDLIAGKGSSSVYISLDHDTLMLVPDAMTIDTDLFEASTKQLQTRMRSLGGQETASQNLQLLDEFDRALSLYQGDYLPGDLYEDWPQRRRDRLRRMYSWLLEHAAELALANGAGERACEYLLGLLERNPADEQTHRQLMLIYARMGRRSDALNQYLLLRKALKEELHAAPLPETNDLLKRIQLGQIPADLGESIRRATPMSPDPAVHKYPRAIAEGRAISQALQETSVGEAFHQAVPEEQPAPRRIDPDRILKAGLVGREEETARLQRAFAQARSGQRRVVFICGEPGIGKSRLASEFTHGGEGARQTIVLRGDCDEMSGQMPYQPIADAIGSHMRTVDPEQLRAILGESAVFLAKIVPELRLKLPDLPRPEPLGSEAERRNLYDAVARYFKALAAGRPLILVLDDLQWADTATIHLLNSLTVQGGGSPFDPADTSDTLNAPAPLFLLLYRTGEVDETHPLRALIAALMRRGIAEELRLQRLGEEQVHQLLINMAGHSVQATFAGEVYRHTEGNPFFVGEAVRSLILEGKIVWTGERWQTTVELSELEIPQSVRLLIERRLVTLSPECRTTLTLASVMGRQFSSELLCQARALSEETIAEHIDSAIQSQILVSLADQADAKAARSTSSLESVTHARDIPAGRHALLPSHWHDLDLAFTHDKIREVLYQWLNPLRRRTLHRQVAQAIETRYAASLQPYYSQLAYHYHMAECYEQAVEYLLKAAEQAALVYAFVDAGTSIKTALDLLIGDKERPQRAALLQQLANIYLYTGRLDEGIQAGLASAALWRDLGDVAKQAAAYLDVAFFRHWQGREAEAINSIHVALDCLAEHPEHPTLLAKAYAQWGLALTVMGEAPEALEKLRQAETFRAQGGGDDPFVLIVSSWSLAWCAFLTESPQKMLEFALQGAEVCRSAGKPDWEPMMNYSSAWAYMLLGRLDEAQQCAQEALSGAQRYGVVAAQSWAYLVMAFVAIQAGQWEDARQWGDKSYTIAEMLHDADLQARVLWSRSVCAGWQHNWEQAIIDVTAALELARKDGEMSMIYPHLLAQAAKACFFAGKPEQAQTHLDNALQMAQARRYRQLPAIAQRLQGRIWQAQARFDDALPCFERSLAELQAIDDPVEHARTEEAYGLFFLARDKEGDGARGQQLLESAQATFRRLGVNG